jgi:nitrogen fixation NifU-like protein
MNQGNDVFDDLEGLMLDEARKIYSKRVIDLFTNPQNYGEMSDATGYTYMSGICGDTIGIFVSMGNGSIDRLSFVTDGCGPTIACASGLTCMAKGLTIPEAMKISSADLINHLGGLPVDHTHCADLAVNTLRGALEKIEEAE